MRLPAPLVRAHPRKMWGGGGDDVNALAGAEQKPECLSAGAGREARSANADFAITFRRRVGPVYVFTLLAAGMPSFSSPRTARPRWAHIASTAEPVDRLSPGRISMRKTMRPRKPSRVPCSDDCQAIELWQGTRRIVSRPQATNVVDVSDAHQEVVLATEELIVRSEWSIARSRQLINVVGEARRHRENKGVATEASTPQPKRLAEEGKD